MQNEARLMLKAILRLAIKRQASDIHINENMGVIFRIFGVLRQEESAVVKAETLEMWRDSLLNVKEKEILQEVGQIDIAYEEPVGQRYRINIFYACQKLNFVFRIIAAKLPIEKIRLFPKIIWELAAKPAGLVIVAGRTGSGKSTTLSLMVEWINQHSARHIITLENPIEYLHSNQQSIIVQREYRQDFASLENAVYAALREDPDVILVGEMRDAVTMRAVLTAAETGHLVVTTLHTGNSAQAIERIITAFPAEQQEQVRFQLSLTLMGVIVQQLVPVKMTDDNKNNGRAAIMEIMTATPAVRNLIREQKLHQLNSQIETGSKWGMQTFRQSVQKLADKGVMINKLLIEQYDDFLN